MEAERVFRGGEGISLKRDYKSKKRRAMGETTGGCQKINMYILTEKKL